MRVTPYCSKVVSELTTGTSSTSAWAMRSRSNGSRWWLGSSASLSAHATVMGRSDACRPASAWFIHCRYGIDNDSLCHAQLDGDLPHRRRTDEKLVGRVGDRGMRCAAQETVLID